MDYWLGGLYGLLYVEKERAGLHIYACVPEFYLKTLKREFL